MYIKKLSYVRLAELAQFSEKEMEIVKELWNMGLNDGWINITKQFLCKWTDAPDESNIVDQFYIYLQKNFRFNYDFTINSDNTVKVMNRCMIYIIMVNKSSKALPVIRIFFKFEEISASMETYIKFIKQEKEKKPLRNPDAEMAVNVINIHLSNNQPKLPIVYDITDFPMTKFIEKENDHENKINDIYHELCSLSRRIINLHKY